jgi:diadenosine tetraphosphate (Ap4A) HIT family hydrolase
MNNSISNDPKIMEKWRRHHEIRIRRRKDIRRMLSGPLFVQPVAVRRPVQYDLHRALHVDRRFYSPCVPSAANRRNTPKEATHRALNELLPRERWDALVRGDGCPLCAVVNSHAPSDAYGHKIVDLQFSRLRLTSNEYVHGYAVLICKEHVWEPCEQITAKRACSFEDMVRSAQALERVFRTDNMNFQILGIAVPHLHCHLVPGYYGHPAPGRPINPDAEECRLPADENAQLVANIRMALA